MGLEVTTSGSGTSMDAVLKDYYLGPVRELLNNASVVLSRAEGVTRKFSGRRLVIPVHLSRNTGLGARAERGDLPTAGAQGYEDAFFKPSYQYGRIDISGPAIKASREDRGSFIRAVDSEMRGLSKDLRQSVSRQIFRNGDGELTACGTTSASTTVNVTSTKYLEVGMVVDIIDQSTDAAITNGDSVSVVTVPSSTTFTVGTAVTTTADEIVVLEDTYGKDVWGLEAMVSQSNPPNASAMTNYGELDRSSVTKWQCADPTTAASSGVVALTEMQSTLDTVDIESGADTGLIVTSHAVKAKYGALLTSLKRFPAGGEITLDGGYKALEFNGIPLVADKDLQTISSGATCERMYFLDMSTFFMADMGDWDWMDQDGAILARSGTGSGAKDAYEAVLYRYFQFICDQPNSNTYYADV